MSSKPGADFALHAASFVLPDRLSGSGYLAVRDGRIAGFGEERPSGLAVVEAPGLIVAPGLVDTHIHGFAGHETPDADPTGLRAASVELARHGTTSWLPTTFTDDPAAIGDQLSAIADAADARGGSDEARIAGAFLEGPFFTAAHGGAQNPAYLRDPDIGFLESWQRRARGMIRKSALAPEREGSVEYIRRAVAEGVVCAIGHTDATYEQVEEAVRTGASVFVHTYNGMRGLTSREPGVVGAALALAGTYAEVIADGIHVHPASVAALVAAKGWAHTVLVSDCLAAGGLPDGPAMSGGMHVEKRDGACYLMEGPFAGNLAGSTLTLAEAVRNVVAWGIATPEQAIRMATQVPADANHIADACGRILPGRPADLCVFTDKMELATTYVGGIPIA